MTDLPPGEVDLTLAEEAVVLIITIFHSTKLNVNIQQYKHNFQFVHKEYCAYCL